MSNEVDTVPTLDIDVVTHGDFPGAAEYARTMITGLARFTRRPILHARVRFTRHRDLAVEFPVIAQATLDVRGRAVRAQVEAATVKDAIDQLESRLRRRLEHLTQLWEPRRGPDAAPPWRHTAEPVSRPGLIAGPAEDSHIIRRKSFTMAPCTVDEAVMEMDVLDYDFHLFTEIGTGAAGVVYRSGPTRLRLALVAPDLADDVAPYDQSVTISTHPVPCLREEDAVERMGALKHPFLFYIDAAQGRASVLYRRYDGNYGVITPAG